MQLNRGRAQPIGLVGGLVIAACIIVLIAGLRSARVIIVPVLVAVFISVACAPMVNGMRRQGVPTWLAVVSVVVVILSGGFVLTLVVTEMLTDFLRGLPRYQVVLSQRLAELYVYLEHLGLRVPEEQAGFNPGVAFNWVALLLNSISALLTSGLLIILTVVFILLEAAGFEEKLRRAVRNPEATFERFALFAAGVKRYLFIKTGVSVLTGVLVGSWVWFLGVEYWLLWGLLAFLLNYIPTFGSIVASIPAALLALVQIGFGRAALVLAGYLALNITIGSILEPRWAGRGVGLSPLVVFLSLILWGWIFGPVGLLLAAPLTMTLKMAFETNLRTLPIAVLLGPEKAPDPAPELRIAAEKRQQIETSDVP
jgi:AI-2 transport protein TqsA